MSNKRFINIVKPRQIVLVTCGNNIITIGWHTRVASSPELYAIAVSKKRHSYELIKEEKCFVVNFVSPELESSAKYCGMHSGEFVDKFKETGLHREKCEKTGCWRIKEASAFMECKLFKELQLNDNEDYSIFIGKVVNKDSLKEGKRLMWSEGKYGCL